MYNNNYISQKNIKWGLHVYAQSRKRKLCFLYYLSLTEVTWQINFSKSHSKGHSTYHRVSLNKQDQKCLYT